MHMADILKGSGQVSARDLTEAKVLKIQENLKRTGLKNVSAEVRDALVFYPEDAQKADIVMADLPCSGLGVMGRKADIKRSVTPEKITALAALQREILSVVQHYVKPGGVLIYSTCTVSKAENEENMQWFEEHFPFGLESLDAYVPEKVRNEHTKAGWIQILPGQYQSDGFFIARFRRSRDEGSRVMSDKTDIKSMTLPELEVFTTEVMGEKKFRAKQIYEWMHVRLADSFDEMTNLSKDLRQKLSEQCVLSHLEMVEKYVSAIDGTAKYLFKLSDDKIIESVLMHYKHGNSVCISSQVGCRMGCRFCASTLGGLERQMLASEMLDEIYQIQKDSGERVSNVVVMGTGEPLDNYDALVRMINILTHAPGLDISQRNVTVSTCGLVPKII